MAPPPELSALLIVGLQRSRGERCLEALLRQSAIDRMEIVVVDIEPGQGPLRGGDAPRVRVIRDSGANSFAAARAAAVEHARAPYVAFVEDHVVPRKDWAAAILSAFERRPAIVNFAFANLNPQTYVSRSAIVAEYGPWMHPAPSGPIRYLSGNNIAYERAALARFGDGLTAIFESEFLLQRAILAAGGNAWLESGAVVAHETWTRLGDAMRSNGSMKQLLAAQRSERLGWGAARRALYAGAMVLSPALHMVRLLRGSAGRPRNWTRTAAAMPLVVVIFVYGAYREAIGYLFGAGNAREAFLAAETAIDRDPSP